MSLTKEELLKENEALKTELAQCRNESTGIDEAFYHKLFSSSYDAILILDPEAGHYRDCNPAALKLFGYKSKADLLKQNPAALSPEYQPDGRRSADAAREVVTHIVEAGEYQWEWYHQRSDGSQFLARIMATAIHLDDRVLLQGIIRNISEQREARDKLTLFKYAVESAADAIGMSTPEGVHYYQNRAFDELFGEIGSNPMRDLYVSTAVGREVFETIMAGREWFGEVEMYSRERSVLSIALRAYSIKDQDGKILGLVGMHSDVTETRRAQEALRESEERIRHLAGNLPSVMIYQVVLQSDGSRQFTYVSNNVEKLNGVKVADVLADAGVLYRQIDSEYLPRLIELEEEAQAKMGLFHCEFKSTLPTGQVKWFELASTPHEREDGAVVWDGVQIDITDRKNTEEMLIQTEKMMSVGGLAAGMAHEINNPLAGILQSMQVVNNRLYGDLPLNEQVARECGTDLETVQAYLQQRGVTDMLRAVVDSGERASEIVDNMLSFSRKSDSQFVETDFNRLVDKTIALCANDYDLRQNLDFRHIEVIRQYDSSRPRIKCERSKIQQVILNILKNGTEAMAEMGIAGKKRKFIIETQTGDNGITLTIENNGPHLTGEVRNRIFEPFYTTKSVGKGTGLGLAVSYFIITENHGGRMWVESSPGRGVRFIVQLPFDRQGRTRIGGE